MMGTCSLCHRPVRAGGLCKTHYERRRSGDPQWGRVIRGRRRSTDDLLKYIESRCTTFNGCLLWQGAVNSDGYGTIAVQGRTLSVHRLAYELRHGPAEALCVLHSCDTPHCILDDHLHLGTQAKNASERQERQRDWQSKITHCPKGHPYDATNTRIDKTGRRVCKRCDYDRPRRGSRSST